MLNVIAGLLNGAGAPASTNSYESIATTTVGAGGSATITFSSIPSTYKHLQLRMAVIGSNYGTLKLNNDTTSSNYYSHSLTGNGSSASASAYASVVYMPFANVGAGIPYVEICDILDYSNANKYKTLRSLAGFESNSNGNAYLNSALWQSTSAVNRLDLTCSSGNFAQYSSFALYGIKG